MKMFNLYCFLCISLFSLLLSCVSQKNFKSNDLIELKQLESNEMLIDSTCNKYQNSDCDAIFNCHYKNFLDCKYPFIYSKIDKDNDVGKFLECCVSIHLQKDTNYKAANIALNHYYLSVFNYAKVNDSSPLLSGVHQYNRFYNIFKSWNSFESFNLSILYMSKNRHDSMGHGDCTNLGIEFFHFVVVPKIESIDGMQPYDYLYKNLEGVYDTNEDCQDSYYNAIYSLIKNAWDNGKIELKDTKKNNK